MFTRGIVGPDEPDLDEIQDAIRQRSVELSRGKLQDVSEVPEWLVEREFHAILSHCYSMLLQRVEGETERPQIEYPNQRARAKACLENQRNVERETAWDHWQPGKPYPA